MAKTTYPGVGDNSPAARAQRETHWRRVVERWKASGLPKSTFSESSGFIARNFRLRHQRTNPRSVMASLEGRFGPFPVRRASLKDQRNQFQGKNAAEHSWGA